MNSSKSDPKKQASHDNNDNTGKLNELQMTQNKTAIKNNKIQTNQHTQNQQQEDDEKKDEKVDEQTDETDTKTNEQKNVPSPVLPDDINSDKLKQKQKTEQELKLELKLALKIKIKEEKKSQMELFNKDYSIREIISHDYDEIFTICDETDLCHKQFFNYLHDDKYLFYACVSKKTTKIIGSVVIMIIDGGYTAFILTLKIHSNHQNNKLERILIQYCINLSLLKYPSIHRFRCIQSKCNTISTLFANKIGFQLVNNIGFVYHSLCTATFNLFEDKLTKINVEYTHNNDTLYNEYLSNFEQLKCRDIDNIICILLYYYKQCDIFIDWKVFDLGINKLEEMDEQVEAEDNDGDNEQEIEEEDDINILGGDYEVIHNEDKESMDEDDEDLYEDDISDDEEEEESDNESEKNIDKYEKDVGIRSITDFKSYLFDFINCGDINVYGINANDMNQENGALCFMYRNVKIRDYDSFYHIFGNNEMAIISMIYSCYYLWKRSVFDKDGKENIYFFVNQTALVENHKLKWLFEHANDACILEKCIDSDDDINNGLVCHEE